MMRPSRLLISCFLALFTAGGAFAELEDVPMVVTEYQANGTPVKLIKTMKSAETPMTLVGFGLRKKKVVLVNVSVYVAAHYVNHPADWKAADVAGSLKKQTRRMMSLTFLRDVGADKIRDAFSDSLKNNGLDPKREDLAKALEATAADVKEGGQLTFVGVTAAGQPQKLYITSAKGTGEAAGATVVDDMWNLWFGKPGDGGLEDLKAQLLTPVK